MQILNLIAYEISIFLCEFKLNLKFDFVMKLTFHGRLLGPYDIDGRRELKDGAKIEV